VLGTDAVEHAMPAAIRNLLRCSVDENSSHLQQYSIKGEGLRDTADRRRLHATDMNPFYLSA